jgi:alpha-tubulin suppressor-like RCC1 family protein
VRSTGTVACWGWNSDGQVGNATTVDAHTPATVGGLAGATLVAAGGRHSCAVVAATNSVVCWGQGALGQLGNGGNAGSLTPVVVMGLPNGSGSAIRQIAAGGGHTCVLVTSGDAYCWGLNDHGQIGDGTTTNRNTARRVMSSGAFVEIRCGDRYTCGRAASGGAACWGNNTDAGLGNGTTTDSSVPTPVTSF